MQISQVFLLVYRNERIIVCFPALAYTFREDYTQCRVQNI